MAKNKISEFSSTPANNTDIGGIDIAEGCAPSGINNAIRELMAQLKDQQVGTDADNFTVGGNLSVTGTTTATGLITATALTTTGNTILGDAYTDTLNVGNNDFIKDASGNVQIGTSSNASNYKLTIAFDGGAVNGLNLYNTNSGGNPTLFSISDTAQSLNNTSWCAQYSDSTTQRWVLRKNGGLSNYQANDTNLSDERTKKDIIDAGNYLNKICAISVRTFLYKDQTDNLLNLGVIAQEVEAVAPELVDVSGFGETPKDGIPLKAIYQTDLQYALMKSIQELKAIVDIQAERIALLENK
jgi:hypothetical protein